MLILHCKLNFERFNLQIKKKKKKKEKQTHEYPNYKFIGGRARCDIEYATLYNP